jgi:hypothetical protein
VSIIQRGARVVEVNNRLAWSSPTRLGAGRAGRHRLQMPAWPIDHRDGQHRKDPPPLPPAVHVRQAIRAHQPDELHLRQTPLQKRKRIDRKR